MVVVSKTRLNEFGKIHSTAAEPLNYWYNIVVHANWTNFSDLKKDFNSADAIGNDRYVFNIKGNSYRLISMIHFDKRTVYIRFIGTHAEYDKLINCSTI